MFENRNLLKNRYEKGKLIGEGGASFVYQGHDLVEGRSIAIKVSKQTDDVSFERETQILKEFNHPNIIKLYDEFESDEGNKIQILEFVHGDTLSKKIKSGVKIGTAINVSLQILDGMLQIQQKGFNHGDIKPANILIGSDNRVKIIDFGTTLKQEGIKRTTSGTIEYMSPERMEGMPVNEQTEIYSLGVTFYEIFTGHKPFGDVESHIGSFLPNRDKNVYTPMKMHNPNIPNGVVAIIDKMLEPKTTKRYKTFEEIQSDFLGWKSRKSDNREIEKKILATEKKLKHFKWFAIALGVTTSVAVGVLIWMAMT